MAGTVWGTRVDKLWEGTWYRLFRIGTAGLSMRGGGGAANCRESQGESEGIIEPTSWKHSVENYLHLVGVHNIFEVLKLGHVYLGFTFFPLYQSLSESGSLSGNIGGFLSHYQVRNIQLFHQNLLLCPAMCLGWLKHHPIR